MRSLSVGDHLRSPRSGGYHHHGIYVGNGWVIHYTDVRPDKRRASIRYGTLAEFADGQRIEIVLYASTFAPYIVVAQAQSRIGETAYDLRSNNCEHFARWCKTGESQSHQVRVVSAGASGAAGSAGAVTASIAAVAAAGLAGLSGPGVMSGLGTVGSAIGTGAVGGLGVLTVAPGAVAAAAVRHALPDDPHLPASERRARQAGRNASVVGAAAGTAAAVAGVAVLGIPGLGAAGITTGLAAMGELVGGGMVAGMGVAMALPVAAAGTIAWLVYRAAKSRRT